VSLRLPDTGRPAGRGARPYSARSTIFLTGRLVTPSMPVANSTLPTWPPHHRDFRRRLSYMDRNRDHLLDEWATSACSVAVAFCTRASNTDLLGPTRSATNPRTSRPITCNRYISHPGTGLRCNVSLLAPVNRARPAAAAKCGRHRYSGGQVSVQPGRQRAKGESSRCRPTFIRPRLGSFRSFRASASPLIA
jgi:hypothetical protein